MNSQGREHLSLGLETSQEGPVGEVGGRAAERGSVHVQSAWKSGYQGHFRCGWGQDPECHTRKLGSFPEAEGGAIGYCFPWLTETGFRTGGVPTP